MDISKPEVSRLLGELIQSVKAEDQMKFIKDAKESPSLEEFLKLYENYRKK